MRAAATEPEALAPLARWIASAQREGLSPEALAANDDGAEDASRAPCRRRRRPDADPIRCVVAAPATARSHA